MDDAFGYWLSGYLDGEGHFGCDAYGGRRGIVKSMTVVARADDYPLLRMCQEQTGLGRMYFVPQIRGSKPCWRWVVRSTAECLRLVEILEKYPLRSKKRRDFEIWAKIVRELVTWTRGPKGPIVNDHDRVERLAKELVAVRQYDARHEET